MDIETYQKKYFVEPQPTQRFDFIGLQHMTLFFSDYEAAVAYYRQVLGDPVYVEGQFTRGWQLGSTWLTLLKANKDSPRNIEVTIVMRTPQDAEALQQAFMSAGGKGAPPSDQLMYEPVRSCMVQDPFGTAIHIISPLT